MTTFRIARLPFRKSDFSRSSPNRSAIGSPTTFEYDPSMRGMNRDASP